MKPDRKSSCQTCEREIAVTFHHLIPRRMHKKRQFLTEFKYLNLTDYGIWVCQDCHKRIHRIFTHELLAKEYNSLEKLKSHEEFSIFLNWVSKQKKRVKS